MDQIGPMINVFWAFKTHDRHPTHKRGFSLVELIAVLAVISVIVILTVPSSMRFQESATLNRAGQTVNDMLALARQEAVSKSHEVQVLFFKTADTNQWRAMQIRRMDESVSGPTPTPVSRVTWLPDGVLIEEGIRSA